MPDVNKAYLKISYFKMAFCQKKIQRSLPIQSPVHQLFLLYPLVQSVNIHFVLMSYFVIVVVYGFTCFLTHLITPQIHGLLDSTQYSGQ